MAKAQADRLPKRPRGRPRGTAVYEQKDLDLLAAFADIAVTTPGAKLAPFLAKRNYAEHEIRRAQKRWRSNKVELLHQAKLRADVAPANDPIGLLLYFGQAASALTDAAIPAFGRIAASLEGARRRVAARRELGLDLGLPLDPRDQAAVEAAIARYDATIASGNHPAEFASLTYDELPLSLKLYYVAVTLHHWSLQVAESEQKDAPAPCSGSAGPNEEKP